MTITEKRYNMAYLILEDGQIFKGKGFGARSSSVGEVVFHTGMTDYQEALHSPTSAGKIVTMTYPLIGNCGMGQEDVDSPVSGVKGVVVKEHCPFPSHWSQRWSLDEWLQKNNIPGLYGIDTRQLTTLIRKKGGVCKGKILSGLSAPLTETELERELEFIPQAQRSPSAQDTPQKEGRSHATLS